MSRYNLEELRQLNIKQVIEDLTGQTFKKEGSTTWRLPVCPFCGSGGHKNGTPGFSVPEGKNFFHCFACGRKGDVIAFTQEHLGSDFATAVNYLGEKYGLTPLPDARELSPWEKKIYAIKTNPKHKAKIYLTDTRRLPMDKIPARAYYYDTYSNAVVFLDNEEKIINLRFIQPEPGKSKSIIKKCCETETLHNKIYDITYRKDQQQVFITEGVINALSLWPRSALAIFTTSNQFTDKDKLARYLQDKDVILAFDPDTAGDKAAKYYFDFISKNIRVNSIARLLLPENKDLNDLLKDRELHSFLANYDNYDYLQIDIRRRPLPFNTKDKDDFELYNGFFIKNSCYAYKKQNRETTHEITVSDCIWQYLYRIIDSMGEARHLIKIQRYDRQNNRLILKLIEADTSQIQRSEWEKILNNYGFNYWGPVSVYNRIKTYNLHNEREVEKIEKFGYHPDKQLFFWSNLAMTIDGKILRPNELGIIETGAGAYYLETASPANENRQDLVDHKKFIYKASDITLKDFAQLFYTAYKEKALIGLAYYTASLHRDLIFNELMRFPNLYLYGPANTGKSSFIEILAALQGDYTGGYAVNNSTQVAFNRLVNSRRNSFIYLKEYSNEKNTASIDEFLKTAYEGVGRTIGVKSTDNRIISYETLTGIIIDANFLPISQEAVFTRMIYLDFFTTSFSKRQIHAFDRLKSYTKKGLTHLNVHLLKLRTHIEKNFATDFSQIYSNLKNKFPNYPDRLLLHSAMILTIWNYIAPLTSLEDKKQNIWQEIQEMMTRYIDRLETFRHSRLFWEAVSLAIKKDNIKNVDDPSAYSKYTLYYRIIPDRNIFAFKSSDFKEYNLLYQKYCKDINVPPLNDKQLKEQLLSSDYYIKPTNGRRTHQDKRFGTTAFYFNYQPVNQSVIQIDGVTIELN